jgi:hypothetical protein
MNVESLPWYHDPIQVEYDHPGDTLKAIRNGSLDLFCGHCGVMGKSGVWLEHSDGLGLYAKCPNCGEYRGQPIREVEPQITWPERQT